MPGDPIPKFARRELSALFGTKETTMSRGDMTDATVGQDLESRDVLLSRYENRIAALERELAETKTTNGELALYYEAKVAELERENELLRAFAVTYFGDDEARMQRTLDAALGGDDE